MQKEKMQKIIRANYKFERAEIGFDEAVKDFEKANQPYKVELIKDIQKNQSTNNKQL